MNRAVSDLFNHWSLIIWWPCICIHNCQILNMFICCNLCYCLCHSSSSCSALSSDVAIRLATYKSLPMIPLYKEHTHNQQLECITIISVILQFMWPYHNGLHNQYITIDHIIYNTTTSKNSCVADVIITGHNPTSVCFNNNVRASLPTIQKLFRKPLVEQPLRAVKKKEIFELARISTNFYKLIIELQVLTKLF